jgi:hypothetical protein
VSRVYDVKTERFGVLQLEAEGIADARRRAGAFGVTNPRMTTLHSVARHCASCDSAPCVCGVRS